MSLLLRHCEEEMFQTVCGCEDPYCIKPVSLTYHSDVEKDIAKMMYRFSDLERLSKILLNKLEKDPKYFEKAKIMYDDEQKDSLEFYNTLAKKNLKNVEIKKLNLLNPKECDLIIKNIYIVIHLAAIVDITLSLRDPKKIIDVNYNGTLNVLEACRKFNVGKIIYTSTGGARVGEPEYLPVDEKHPLKPCSPYGISKHSAEHYVWMYKELYGVDYFIFCFGNVYGPRDDVKSGRLIPVFVDMMLRGESPKIFGDGGQTRDFIYVLDLADFIVDNLEKSCDSKLFHLAYGKQVSVNEVFNNLKEILDFKGEAEKVEAMKGEVRDIVLDIGLAERELGWSPRFSLKEGLEASVDWFKLKQRERH